MQLDDLTIGQAKQLAGMFGATATTPPGHLGGSAVKILICQRGFVFVGRVSRDGSYLVAEDALNIRRWGTTRGLGELASNGPVVGTTQLDAAGTLRVHELSVVALLDCDDARWANALAR